jgi:hypothetical protein
MELAQDLLQLIFISIGSFAFAVWAVKGGKGK